MAETFDREQLEHLAGGDKAFENELLQLFVGDTENSLSQLDAAISSDSRDAVQSLAHYIKGASANVGAVGMSQTAAQLEKLWQFARTNLNFADGDDRRIAAALLTRLAQIDPQWAKRQLVLLMREWYMHPNGQIPDDATDGDAAEQPVTTDAIMEGVTKGIGTLFGR